MKRSLFLIVSLVVMVGFVFTPSIAQMMKYKESLMLMDMVNAGKLPPVAERLPDKPSVISAEWNNVPKGDLDFQIGKFGGTLRTVRTAPGWDADVWSMMKETLVEAPGWMDSDPKDLRGSILEDYEMSADAKTFTFHMRKGLKWSDGMPVTSDDVLFAYEDVNMHNELGTAHWSYSHQWMKTQNSPNGEPMSLKVIDTYTFQVSFPKPYPGFINNLAVFWASYRDMLKPKHYLKQFHIRYTPLAKIKPILQKEGMEEGDWAKLFVQKDIKIWDNTQIRGLGFPSLSPWTIVEVNPTTTIFERNPYYFKVDSEGQQLPYIDRVRSEHVPDREAINLKIVAGELDIVEREAGGPNLPFFKDNEARGNYKVTMLEQHFAPVNFYLNQTNPDPVWRQVAQDVRFRRALNMAIDREDIIDKVFFGFAELPEVVPSVYDPEGAKRLLDEIGLDKLNSDGFRLGPDGKVFDLAIEWAQEAPAFQPVIELVARDWSELGLKVTSKEVERSLLFAHEASNETKISTNWDDLEKWWLFATIAGSPALSTVLWHRYYTSNGEKGEKGPDWLYDYFDQIGEIRSSAYNDAQRLVSGAQKIMSDNLLYIVTVQKLKKPLLTSNSLGNVPTSGMVLVGVNSGEQLFFK